ncbi:MAG: hypothetical protein ACYS6Z_01485 [Planctomycetota bacterium]
MRTLLIALLLASPAARASYFLPAVKDRHFVVADQWGLTKHTLFLKRGATTYRFQVDLFWLADRIASDSICTGGYRRAMETYLKKLKAKKKRPPLVVELVNTKKQRRLFAAGVWPHEGTHIYDRVKRGGTPKLLPHADAVKLEDAKALAKVLQKRSAAGWKALAAKKK